MDKKLHEDLNRIRKLSGLTEQTLSHTSPLPGGGEREWYYRDTKPQQGWQSFGGSDSADHWNNSGGGTSSGTGAGGGGTGNYAGNDALGGGRGGSQGFGRGQGLPGSTGAGTSTGASPYPGVTPDGQRYHVYPGAGGGGISRVYKDDGTAFSVGPGKGGNPSIDVDSYGSGSQPYATPGRPGGYDDGDIDSDNEQRPLTKRERIEFQKQQRIQDQLDKQAAAEYEAEQRRQAAADAKAARDAAQQEKLQKQQQAKPNTSAITGDPLATPTPPRERIAPQILLPTKPNTSTITGDPMATPKSAEKPQPITPPTKPNTSTITGDPLAEPTKPIEKPAPNTKPNTSTVTGDPLAEPAKPIEKPVPNVKPNITTVAGDPMAEPTKPIEKPTVVTKHEPEATKPDEKVITSHPTTPTTINVPTDSKPVTSSDNIEVPPVLTTKEPSSWDVPEPGEYKPGTSTPITTEPKASISVAPEKQPSIAQQILLPNEPKTPSSVTPGDEAPPIEVMLMDPNEIEKTFGPMPGSNAPPAAKGNNGGGKIGSGLPSSSAQGGSAAGDTGASGEKGSPSSSKPYVPITPKTIGSPVSDQPSWAAQQRAAQGKPFSSDPKIEPPNTLTVKGPSNSNSAEAQDRASDMQKVSNEVENSSNKPNESMERMLQLAGIKEAVKIERQILQESTVSKKNTVTDTIMRLAGLK